MFTRSRKNIKSSGIQRLLAINASFHIRGSTLHMQPYRSLISHVSSEEKRIIFGLVADTIGSGRDRTVYQ